jgi:cytoskeletal protein CcmA (bactofilin family)
VAPPPLLPRVTSRNSIWNKTKNENSKPKSPPVGKSPIEQLKEQAVIGPCISIKDELSGEEDLMIQGRVEGKIDLKKKNVTVGRNGHIEADIYGKVIGIEGEVQGNLFGEEKIVVRESAVVRGNIRTPRFSLKDGAKFKGSIDMIRTMEDSSQHKKK